MLPKIIKNLTLMVGINKINKIFLLFLIFINFSDFLYAAEIKDFVVVIDAGHGGKDAGAHGPFGNEKDVTLNVSLKLGRELEKKAGVKVIYTRTTDIFVELARRAQIANDNKADLFISIHCNSAHSGASGTETWVLGTEENRESSNFNVVKRENSVIYLEDDYEKTYDGFDPNSAEDVISMTLLQDAHYESSVQLAGLIEQQFVNKGRKSRGVKQSGFAVLWRTAMPSVLVEMGFISNYSEGQFICSDGGQNEVAHSIELAFDQYKSRWDKKNQSQIVKVEKPKEQPIANGFYKIQLLASDQLYPPNAAQFRGLENIERIKKGSLYKYYYGETNLESQKKTLIEELKKKGFNSAYPVLFKDDSQYKIELFSSRKKYSTQHSIFDEVPAVDRIKNDKGPRFSYYTARHYNYANALKTLKEIRSKNFENAVLVNISD